MVKYVQDIYYKNKGQQQGHCTRNKSDFIMMLPLTPKLHRSLPQIINMKPFQPSLCERSYSTVSCTYVSIHSTISDHTPVKYE